MDGAVTKYVYAGDTVIAEYDGLDQLQARYVPGPGIDKPVLMDRGATLSYYHYDGSGSVIAVTDGFGAVAETYAFGPYGESADGDLIGNPYRYTGRRLDPETGLYYYRARYYDPITGRFLQPDPAGTIDGLNLYAYVGNDPLNLVDPSGLVPQSGKRKWDVLSAGIRQPRYDTADAVALDPGGPGATGFVTADLRYSLDDGVSYRAGITLANIDRGFWSDLTRIIVGSVAPFSGRSMNSNEVKVTFDATIPTADGTYESSFTVTGQLAVDGWLYVPIWRNIGPLEGPGTVNIKVTNEGKYRTGVTVGANQVQ